jgi:PhnB protein
MTIYLNPYIGFITGYWQKLIDGGNVTLPLAKAIWGDTFGMCLDRFGIG